jgi:hypothetical protein
MRNTPPAARASSGATAGKLSPAERSALNQALAKALAFRDAGKYKRPGNGLRNLFGC